MVSEVRVSAKDKLQSLVEDLWINGDLSREACSQLQGLALEISGQMPSVYKFRFRRIKKDEGVNTACSLEIIAKTEKEALLAARVLSDDIDVIKGHKFIYALLTVRQID